MLEDGGAVDVFALPDDGLLHYGRFHLNVADGLEEDLIRMIDPEWNGVRTETNEGTEEVGRAASSEVTGDQGSFEFVLHPTYLRSGFFNVRVTNESLFGGEGEEIELHVPGREAPIQGVINRTANQNATPRIMGGTELRDWFQEVVGEGETVVVTVMSPNAVHLSLVGP